MNASYFETRSENDVCVVNVAVLVDSLPVRGDDEDDPEASATTERNMNSGILMVKLSVLSSRHARRSDDND
jgi:hypothetical protein